MLITAERDGDTVSPERGVYLVDLSQKVTRDELRARVRTSLDRERDLRSQRGADVRAHRRRGRRDHLAGVDRPHLRLREVALRLRFEVRDPARAMRAPPPFSSTPTSRSATSRNTSRFSTGFRTARPGQTANVVATLKARTTPSSSTSSAATTIRSLVGPGADDDSSGTAALLETATDACRTPAAGDDRLRVVHRRRGRPLRQPRVRAPRGRRQAAHRRRAQQRHDRLGQRRAARQHHPLLERRHPRRAACRRDPVLAT